MQRYSPLVIVCAHNEARHDRGLPSFPAGAVPAAGRDPRDQQCEHRCRQAPWRRRFRASAWSMSRAKAWWSRAKRDAREARRRHPGLRRRRLPRAADVARADRAPVRRRSGPRSRCPGRIASTTGTGRGRALIRAYDFTLAPATQLLVKHVLRHRHDLLRRQLRRAARGARARSAASTRRSNSTARTPTSGRRLFAIGKVSSGPRLLSLHVRPALRGDGQGRGVPALRPQLHLGTAAPPAQGHGPPGREDLMPGYEPFLLCDFHVHTHVERRPAVACARSSTSTARPASSTSSPSPTTS